MGRKVGGDLCDKLEMGAKRCGGQSRCSAIELRMRLGG